MLGIVRLSLNKLQQVLLRKPACTGNGTLDKEAITQTIQHPNLIPENLDFKIKLADFKKLVGTLQTINNISSVLVWDSSITLPERATEDRASQMSYLTKASHEILTSKEMEDLIKYFEKEINFTRLNKSEKALLQEIKSQYKREKYIPATLLQELASTKVKAMDMWLKANEAQDFFISIPNLEKIITLKRKIAEHIGYEGSPYNALLEYYEPGLTTEKLDNLFKELKNELIPMIKKINGLSKKTDPSFLNKHYSIENQMKLGKELLEHIGFDFSRGCLDQGSTSFSLGITPNDVRLASCIFENNIFFSIATLLHEGFHGLYDQGLDPTLANTPLFDAFISMHESQARLGESIIGQGLPFWKFYFPKLKELFPEQLKDISSDQFYRAINTVPPSFNWSEADEIECNLHICTLYEIEKSLIEGTLSPKKVYDFWSKKLEEYCGITPPNDAICSHWSDGDIGYLPTYTLGNLYAAQIYNTMKKEMPDLEEQIAGGNMVPAIEWLKEKIFKYGKTENPSEIMIRVTGETLNPKYYLSYIKDKYSKIYDIDL